MAEQIRPSYFIRQVKATGSHFFNRDTMRFFDSLLHTVYNTGRSNPTARVLVTSEVPWGVEQRRYFVRLAQFGSDPLAVRIIRLDAGEGAGVRALGYATLEEANARAREVAEMIEEAQRATA